LSTPKIAHPSADSRKRRQTACNLRAYFSHFHPFQSLMQLTRTAAFDRGPMSERRTPPLPLASARWLAADNATMKQNLYYYYGHQSILIGRRSRRSCGTHIFAYLTFDLHLCRRRRDTATIRTHTLQDIVIHMQKIKNKAQSVHKQERKHRTDGHYRSHYLPANWVVNNKMPSPDSCCETGTLACCPTTYTFIRISFGTRNREV